MITIEKVNAFSRKKVEDFLKSVPSIEKIDEKILDNAIVAQEDDKIVGCISFEVFSEKALIRYFVFKKILSLDYLKQLLNTLEEEALKQDIEVLVCIAECSQIEELFQSLSFKPVESKMIFINEENILKTSFQSSLFLCKELRQE